MRRNKTEEALRQAQGPHWLGVPETNGVPELVEGAPAPRFNPTVFRYPLS